MTTFNINPPRNTRIVILGAGFGGLFTALALQKKFKRDKSVHITLVNRHNYFQLTPLLFEAGSGVLEPRHAVAPIRDLLKKTRFVEAEIEKIDLENQVVHGKHTPSGLVQYELPYDHLIVALGGVTNRAIIPGADLAMSFKTLRDAIMLRNHIIDLYEQADAQADSTRRQELFTFVIIGGGLVGVELMGELTEFIECLASNYPRLEHFKPRFVLVETQEKILPEIQVNLAEYATRVMRKRGVEVLTSTKVLKIEPTRVHLDNGEIIDSATIVLAAGVGPNPLIETLPIEKMRRRIATEPTMRTKGNPHVWAIGDCAAIPDPQGKLYPQLAQHALREAKVLARNMTAVIRAAQREQPEPKLVPFVYKTLGTLAALGHYRGVGKVFSFKLKGFLAWWTWRTYYLMQMPRWSRRFRIMLDWTTSLFFKYDIVKLDFDGDPEPGEKPRPVPQHEPLATTTAAK